MSARHTNRLGLAVVVLTTVFLLAGLAVAQDAPVVTADDVNDVAKTIYCPVCENITLDTCPTAACDDWRYEVRLQLEAGSTPDEIRADFVRRFGDRVVGTPFDPVLRAISFIVPILAALGVGALIFVLGRRARRTPAEHRLDSIQPATTTHDGLSPQERLRAEIERDIAR